MALSTIAAIVILAVFAPIVAFQIPLYSLRWYEIANRNKDGETFKIKAIFSRRMRPLTAFIMETIYSAVYCFSFLIALIAKGFARVRKSRPRYELIDSDKPLTVLIHGVFSMSGLFWLMRLRFRFAKIPNVVTFSYSPFDKSETSHHEKLRDFVLGYRSKANIKKTILVGHSFGGIISFDYAAKYGKDEVLGMVALATPFHGSRLGVFGLTRLARSLTPWNPRFGKIIATAPPAPLLSIYSRYDQIVLPYTNCEHPLATSNEMIETCGHSGVIFDPTAFKLMRDWIRKLA